MPKPRRTPVQSYRDLDVWKLSMDLVVEVYRVTAKFPNDERFGLTAQLRKAAVSVPANVAEGSARSTSREYSYFASISRGSVAEMETELIVAERLGYITSDVLEPMLERTDHISRMLTNLRRSLGS
jgi:four helix bundle protein